MTQPNNVSDAFFQSHATELDRVIEAIASADVDIVALQEVNDGQAETIAQALDLNVAYAAHNAVGYASYYGNAVLSRFHIDYAWRTPIGGHGTLNRGVVTAINSLHGRRVAIVSVHVHHQLAGEHSLHRIATLTRSLTVPAIVMGDFNMEPDDPRLMSLLGDGRFHDSAADFVRLRDLTTRRTKTRARRIDYVLLPPHRFRVRDADLVDPVHHQASDHIAYRVALRLSV